MADLETRDYIDEDYDPRLEAIITTFPRLTWLQRKKVVFNMAFLVAMHRLAEVLAKVLPPPSMVNKKLKAYKKLVNILGKSENVGEYIDWWVSPEDWIIKADDDQILEAYKAIKE